MRLFEFAPNETLEGTLLTVLEFLKSKNKNAEIEVKVPFESISKLMQNAGYTLSYEELKDLNDAVPSIGNVVKEFDQDTVTLRTGSGKDENEYDELNPDDYELDGEEAVDDEAPRSGQEFLDPNFDPNAELPMEPMGGMGGMGAMEPEPNAALGGEKFDQVSKMAQRAVNRRK